MDGDPLETIRAFANTLSIDEGTDGFATPEELAHWLAQRGLAPASVAADRAALARAIRLRSAIRGLLHHNAGGPLDPADVAACDAQARRSRIRLGFSGLPPAPVLAADAAGVDAALGRLLVLVAEAMESGAWARLKLCGAEDCRWAFLDGSRNGSRHWCAMEICGNREKVRAYRARRR